MRGFVVLVVIIEILGLGLGLQSVPSGALWRHIRGDNHGAEEDLI